MDSILAQTYQDFELILLDDGSTDESCEILTSYGGDPRVRIEFNKKNSGSTFKQWNKGVRMARGKYVWIAESDDYADECLLEKLTARLDAEPSVVFAYCRSWQVSANDELNGFQDTSLPNWGSEKWEEDFLIDGEEACSRHFVLCNTVLSTSSVVFRREAYWRAGGADETLLLCGDWKVWAAMAAARGAISHVGTPLNYHRFHEATVRQKSGRNGVWPREAVSVIGWILERVTLDKPMRTRVCMNLSQIWIPALFDRRIPMIIRWEILRSAIRIDSNAPLRLLSRAVAALQRRVARLWRQIDTSVR